MLISHVHRFIYMKTFKAAGTSVEIYFERYCTDPNREFEERHRRGAEVSKWGIIGARQSGSLQAETWYNHMAADRVLALIGPELWSSYYKFCVVRHPFDKMVSSFWHNVPDETRLALQHADFEVVRGQFQNWLKTTTHPVDLQVFTIANRPVMDRFVRYEDLHAGLAGVCQDLGLPWEPARLGRYKSDTRLRDEPFMEYYDRSSADLLRQLCKWELEYFQYPVS
jgi:hypothetical protein